MKYEVRYFFDLGGGVCLWSKNDAAREKFGYPIDHSKLGVHWNTERWLRYLIAWYDTSFDWDDSPGDLWSEEDRIRFGQAAARGLDLLRAELRPPQWEIFDELKG